MKKVLMRPNAVKMYKANASINEIAREYGVTADRIRRILVAENVKIRTRAQACRLWRDYNAERAACV